MGTGQDLRASSQPGTSATPQPKTTVGLWEWDAKQRTISWTAGMYEIHEGDPWQTPGDGHQGNEVSFIGYDPEDRRKMLALLDRCIEKGEPYDLECAYTTLRGRRLWVRTMAHALIDGGKIVKVLGCLMDLSNQVQASAHLLDESLRRRTLMEASRDGIAIIDQQHRVVEANAAFAAMLGYSPREVLELSTWDFEMTLSEEQIRLAFSDLSTIDTVFETRHRRKDGTQYDAEVCASGTLVGGKPMIFTISRDITERKLAEKALRQNEEKFRLAFHTTPDPSVIARLSDGRIVDVNRSFIENSGYSLEQVVGRTSLDFNFWSDPAARQRLYDELHAHGLVRNMEVQLIPGSGQVIPALVSAAVFDLQGEPHIYFSARSVREQKVAEAELRASETRNRQILQTAMDGFCRVDRRGRIIEVNQSYCRMTGYSADELLSMSVRDVAVMDDEAIELQLRTLAENGFDRFESRQQRKDGSLFDVEVSVQVRKSQADAVEFVSFLRDISEMKRAEWIFQQLHALGLNLSHAGTVEETLRLALAAALEISGLDCGGIYLFDPLNGGLSLAAQQAMPQALVPRVARIAPDDPRTAVVLLGRAAYFGYGELAIIDRALAETLGCLAVIPIAFQDRVIACLNLGWAAGHEIPHQVRRHIESLAAQLGGYVARSLLEEELRESRARYSALFEHAPVAVWELDFSAAKAELDHLVAEGGRDVEGYFAEDPQEMRRCVASARIHKVNRESSAIFQRTRPEELNGNLELYFKEAAWQAFARGFGALARGELSFQAELPIVDLLGHHRDLIVRMAVCPGFERDLSRVLVSFLDITDQKRAELLLRQSNRALQAISECRKALLCIDNERELLQEICRIICEEAGHSMAWVAMFDEEETASLRVAAMYGQEDGFLAQVHDILSQSESSLQRHPLQSAIQSGHVTCVEDLAEVDDIDLLAAAALAQGYRSSVYCPLKNKEGRVFGTLNIYAMQVGTFSAAETALLVGLARDLAYGIGFLRIRREQDRSVQVNTARLDLISYAQTHSLAELLEETLNVAESLTASCLGFYHLVDETAGTAALQASSGRTKSGFCQADCASPHYDLVAGGVWVDCFRRRQPVIHNEYESLPHRRGMPAGHAEVTRFLSVPVMRGAQIKAILSVGNKVDAYVQQDIELVSLLADLAWEIVERKREEDRREEIEAQLRQAQKMEAVGTLAGGIAHDFNNILSVIIGYGEMVLADACEGKVAPGDMRQVLQAADRAKNLVKQILTFSRKVEIDFKPLNLNRQVEQASQLLGKTLPKMITLKLQLTKEPWTIKADANQIEQILVNLIVNAADAMDGEGIITITTANVEVGGQICLTCGKSISGSHLALEIADTGHGMDEEVRRHIFEPFYSTKPVGKGTGLGLSTVYGIVLGHGGHVACDSEPGRGTRFTVFFPVQDLDEQAGFSAALPEAAPFGLAGHELILIVDDEEPLRRIATRQLQVAGYRTLTADSGEAALAIYGDQSSIVDLVILDLSMPGMGGYKALQEMLRINPQVEVIIASGYAANNEVSDSLESGAAGYVAKPYNQAELLTQVRRVLDEKG